MTATLAIRDQGTTYEVAPRFTITHKFNSPLKSFGLAEVTEFPDQVRIPIPIVALIVEEAIEDNKDAIVEACKKDLGKGFFESMIAEVAWVQNDIIFMTKNLEKWCKDEKPDDIDLTNKFMSPRIRKDPLGLVLVVG